jgi:hypothetical protein
MLQRGYTKMREYKIWGQMKDRCFNPRCKLYPRWGGRGITVCERWFIFEYFLQDMGRCPDRMTLERIDNDGDYEPSNCKWATYEEQNTNRKGTTFYKHDGKKMTLPQWARHLGIPWSTLYGRIKYRGISFEKAIKR